MKTADLDYQDGALACRGFLAYDDTKTGKRPGILLVHAAFGLGETVINKAKRLAELGYVALAADMFGNRKIPADFQEAMSLISGLLNDSPTLIGRADAGLAALAKLPEVDPSKLAAIGFCFGGTTVLSLARQGRDLAAVVSFHGGLKALPPAIPNGVKAKVLACTGADDPMIPASDVVAFQESMTAAHADWQVISYSDTVHSFTDPTSDGSVNPALRYNASSDQRSWSAMRNLFDEAFA